MGHTIAKRTIVAVAAGTALLLSSAGGCGTGGEVDEDNPGVSNQQGDDDGEDDD